jgi:hypothetical protein
MIGFTPAVGELVRCTDGPWMTRPPQGGQVVGVHAGFIDTDMVSAIRVSKMTPAEVAQRIVAGLDDGAVEVLTDDITANAKAALSGPVECLTFALAQ